MWGFRISWAGFSDDGSVLHFFWIRNQGRGEDLCNVFVLDQRDQT